MNHIVLTEEQARAINGTAGEVEVREAGGRVVGFLNLLTPLEVEMVTEALQRRHQPGPRVPSARVQGMLRRFEELEARGEYSREKMEEIVRRVQAGEPL
jgi:hypothetical protein